MKKRKTWRLLSQLSLSEQEYFLRFLQAKFDEKQQALQKVAAALVERFPEAPSEKMIWEVVHPDIPFDDARIRKLLADLRIQIEEFVSYQSFQKSPLEEQRHLLRQLLLQPDVDLFGQAWRKSHKDTYRFSDSAAEFARHRYELEVLNREYRLRHRMKSGSFGPKDEVLERGITDSFQRIKYALDAWNIFQQLLLLINMANLPIPGRDVLDIAAEKQIIDLATTHPFFRKLPLISLYLRILQLSKPKEGTMVDSSGDHDRKSLEALLRYLYRYDLLLPNMERKLLFGFLLNRLIDTVRKREEAQIIHLLLDLYMWGIRRGLLLNEGLILPAHFKNILALCLRVKDIPRAQRFVEACQQFLPPTVREEILALHALYIAFAEGDYITTIRLANQSTFSKAQDEIDARSVLLQAHYDLGNQDKEWFDTQINRLIRYTRQRSELSQSQKKTYLSRFQLYRRLFLADTSEEFQRLASLVEESPGLDKGGWVAEKLLEKWKH